MRPVPPMCLAIFSVSTVHNEADEQYCFTALAADRKQFLNFLNSFTGLKNSSKELILTL